MGSILAFTGRIRDGFRASPEWLKKRLGANSYLILAAILVGIVSALAAAVLKNLVDLVRDIPGYVYRITESPSLYFFLPLAGILLTVLLVKLLFKGKLDKGIGTILFSIQRKSSVIERNKTWSHILTSGITVGFGGSAGLEAPIVVTGSALGSNIAGFFRFGYKERTLLLACGAAAGIAAIFNSPIAGVLFAVEVLLIDLSIPLFIPLLIATATSAIVSRLLYSGQLFHLITTTWLVEAIPFYILLGVVCGLLSVYMTRVTLYVESFFEYRKNTWMKAVIGGFLLAVMVYIFPPLFGEGYNSVTSLLDGSYESLGQHTLYPWITGKPLFLVLLAVAIVLIKPFATAITLGSGGNGGIFAPSLFTGALAGFALAYGLNLTGFTNLQVTNFIAVGMAGIMAGVIHAPLTAIFLIAEISGGYMLFVPLMIVAATSYFISRYFEPYSIYTKNLIAKGFLDKDNKDRNILDQLSLRDMLETDYYTVHADAPFSSLIQAFTQSKRNVFPVINDAGEFLGVVFLEDIKEMMFRPELQESRNIAQVMRGNIATLELSEDVSNAIEKFEHSGLWNIPVTENGKYAGFISWANMLNKYRREIKKSATLV